MNFLEKDLEDIIYDTPNKLLRSRGLKINGKKFRQIKLGNYGILDLLTVKYCKSSNHIVITVFELKKDIVNINTFLQAVRYVKGLQRYIKKSKYSTKNFRYNIVLVGSEVNQNSDFIYLPDLLSNNCNLPVSLSLENYYFKYNVDGIKFINEKGYNLLTENFKIKANHQDIFI